MTENVQWQIEELTTDLSCHKLVEKTERRDSVMAFFFKNRNRIESVRIWDDKLHSFLKQEYPDEAFVGKSEDDAKDFVEMVLRMEGRL